MEQLISPVRQDRSRKSLARITAAAEDLLREQGLAGLSIAAISARSKISVGGIYARVHGKQELYQLLKEHAMARIVDSCRAALMKPAVTFAEVIDAFVEAHVAVFARDEKLQRALFAQGTVQPELGKAGIMARRSNILELVAALCRVEPRFAAYPLDALDFGGDAVVAIIIDRLRSNPSAVIDWTVLAVRLRLQCTVYYQALLGLGPAGIVAAEEPQAARTHVLGQRRATFDDGAGNTT